MKILHVNAGNETGGGKSHIVSLLSQFNPEEVDLLVFEEGPVAEHARKYNINVYVIENKFNLLFTIKSIEKLINKKNYDVIHTHGPRANFFIGLTKKKSHLIWTTTIHSDPLLDFENRGIIGAIFKKLNIWSYSKIDCFLLITESFKTQLTQMNVPENKIITIYNAIDYSDKNELTPLPKQLNSNFILLIVARLQPVKNHALLLQALSELELNNVTLLIAGDGPLEDNLKSISQDLNLTDSIEFLGHQEDVDTLYQLADVCLLTSYSEGFPTVLLEAAKFKCPAIATNVGATKQIIPHSDFGWVIDNNKDSLKIALTEAYIAWKENRLAHKGELFHKYAKTNFSMPKLAKDIKAIYCQLLQTKK